jgi:hypothetical protein
MRARLFYNLFSCNSANFANVQALEYLHVPWNNIPKLEYFERGLEYFRENTGYDPVLQLRQCLACTGLKEVICACL